MLYNFILISHTYKLGLKFSYLQLILTGMSKRDVGEVGTTSNPSPYNEENYNKFKMRSQCQALHLIVGNFRV